MASQAEVTRAEQSLMEKSAALLQEARKNSEVGLTSVLTRMLTRLANHACCFAWFSDRQAAKEMCKQLADGSSQRRRLDKGKEKATEETQGRAVDDESSDEDEVSDEELRALLRDIPQFDGGDDEPPAATTVPLHKKRPLGVDAPKRSVRKPSTRSLLPRRGAPHTQLTIVVHTEQTTGPSAHS
jgi:hypothetical protein